MWRLMRFSKNLLLIVLLLVVGVSAQENGGVTTPLAIPPVTQGSLTPLSPEEHLLRPGDQMVFHIASLPQMPSTYTIRVDGFFYHPLIGEVQASGHTLADLRTIIQTELAKELRNPHFRLGLVQVAQHTVAVLGEANKQGTFQVGVGASVLDVIAAAGGLSVKADTDRAVLMRGDEKIEVPLDPEKGGGLTKVRTGDILYVLPGAPVSVSGEVTTPGVYAVSRVSGNPRDAILAAGGAKEEASLTRVRLIRATLPKPIILDLTPDSEEALPEEAAQLQEGDILIVPARQAVILGAVSSPGPVPLRGDETLLDILPSRVNEGSNIRQILVVRAENVKKNRDEKEEYDLEKYFKDGDAEIVVPIRDGDLVYVPPKKTGGGLFGKFNNIFSIIGLAQWFL
jgi:polysaccharide biosynthesis/export protein